MGLFSRILIKEGLLLEDANVSDITSAIESHKAVKIRYKTDQGDNHTGERLIYPVAYGITTAGNPAVRAFEREGDTNTQVPAWKLFLINKIQTGSWKNLDITFNPKELRGFNQDGDKQFSTLYSIAPIKGQNIEIQNNEPVIHGKPITKQEVERGTRSQDGEYSGEDAVNDIVKNFQYKGLDKMGRNYYTDNDNSEITAPDTKPIKQSDIATPEEVPTTREPEVNITAPATQPITKSQIDDNDKEAQETLANMRNLTSRMNQINRQEEENGTTTT